MLSQLLAKGCVVFCLGVALLPFSMFLREELRTSVGGTPTGEVFVPQNSEAARRGYALSGEGRPANVVRPQMDRSKKVLLIAVAIMAAGFIMISVPLIAKLVNRNISIGTDKSVGSILLSVGGLCFGVLFFGAIGGILLTPLKTIPDEAFNAVLALAGLGAAILIALKRFDPNNLLR